MSTTKKPHPLAALVGRRIAHIRQARGWTQAELGRRLGLSQKWISSIERARTTPQLDTLAKIARALAVQPFELLLPEAPRATSDLRRMVGILKRCDDRSREYLSRVMESFTDYRTGREE